jgi:non-specific protein-tyrosine kinase
MGVTLGAPSGTSVTSIVLRFVRRHWPLLIVGPLIGLAIGLVLLQRIAPVYEADVTLLVNQGNANGATSSTEVAGAEELARTYAAALRTRRVLRAAADQVGLAATDAQLQQAVSANSVTGTQLLSVTVDNTDPERAAQLANALVDVFQTNNTQDQQGRYASSEQNLAQLLQSERADIDSRSAQVQQLQASDPSPQRDADLARLQAELAQLQTVLGDTTRTYEDLRVSEARGMNTVSVLEPAVTPTAPVRPSRPVVIGLSLVAGLGVALLIALLLSYLDDRLLNRQQITAASGQPVLGEVPRWKLARGGGTVLRLLAGEVNDPETRRAAESYRLVLSNLMATAGKERLQVLVVASATAAEGKSTTAANLAVVQADAGRRVILVDANLYKPTQMRLFNVPHRAGLSTLLLNESESVDALLRPMRLSELRVLTSGPPTADPSGLFYSERLGKRLAELREQCDLLVIDTPPLLALPDAALLSAHADAVLMVVDASVSRRSQFQAALEMLVQAGGPVVGAVFNRAPRRVLDYATNAYRTTPGDGTGGAGRGVAALEHPLPTKQV